MLLAIGFNWGQSGTTISGTGVSVSPGPGEPINVNDLLIACVVPESSPGSSNPGTVVAPPGWVQLDNTQLTIDANLPADAAIFYKIATADDAAGNFSFTWSNSAACSWTLIDYSGVDTSNPIDAYGGHTNTSAYSTATTAPSIVTTNAGDTLVDIWISKGGAGPYQGDSSETVRADSGAFSNQLPRVMVADKVLSSSGDSGTDSMTEQYATVGQRGFAIALNCAPVCFMPGTLIRTPDGQVEIEKIARGDFVMTADGRRAQVGWVGRQTVCMHFADPLRARPIRIKANALGENVPSRDLLVSPDHAILVENILVQAGALVNGHSIVRETDVPLIFTYYNVELDDHSLIVAENTLAETFVDNVDRLAFDNWSEHEALYPDGKAVREMDYPRAKSQRQVPRSLRERLDERGARLFATGAKVAA